MRLAKFGHYSKFELQDIKDSAENERYYRSATFVS